MTKDNAVTDLAKTHLDEPLASKVADLTAPLADATETVTRVAKENVGLSVLGGVTIAVAVGALLLPLGRRRKKPQKAARALAALAATVTELTQALAAQAADRAQSTAADAQDKLSSASDIVGKTAKEQTESLTKQTKKLAEDAAEQLNDSGKALARAVIKLVDKVRS